MGSGLDRYTRFWKFFNAPEGHPGGLLSTGPLNYLSTTLTKDGMAIVRKTEFTGVGHFVTELPFTSDLSVIPWLFDHSMTKR